MKKIALILVLNLVFFTSCESDKDILEEESSSVSKTDDVTDVNGYKALKEQMELFTDNLKKGSESSSRALSGSIPSVNIAYSGNTHNVTGNIILNQTAKPEGARTQWLTCNFTGYNFFGGHPLSPNQAGTHVAIGLFGQASSYLSGVGLILGADARGAQHSTAYYESYWEGGVHLDFSPSHDYPFNLANHPPLYDLLFYRLIIHVNDNEWIWFRILDNNYNIVMDRVRRYENPNMEELLSSTGIFIQGIKNYPFPNNSYQLSLSNLNYGWF